MTEIFIKRIRPNVYDVFTDKGWNNWTRVRRSGDRIVVLDGIYLNRSDLNHVKERLIRK